jgi:Zn-dependent membrane protease YugP
MPLLIVGAVLAILVYVPSFWVRHIMSKHSKEIAELPGTGGELAKHLIERFELTGITVEEAAPNTDHFDPSGPVVRISPDNFNGRSLTAVAVAAHEVGHAMQFHRGEKIFELRKRYLPLATKLNRVGVVIMMTIPFIALLIRMPLVIGGVIAVSLLLQLAGAFAYLIILPEEWDASFNKALPVLIEGENIEPAHRPAVRQVLKAAALTYFAAALANVLHVGRWFMLLRR